MEVSGRIEVEPQESWLNLRLKSVSTEDLKKELGRVKEDQRQNVVTDTLAALVYDVNATAEEIEYRLRLTPAADEEAPYFDQEEPVFEPGDDYTVDHVKKDYGVELDESQISSLKRRARSATPRRTLNIEPTSPLSPIAICAFCNQEIDGPVLTALAPNASKAQKFHPYHFMCCYCQKALNLHGTFREHELRPYCHECFYKLWNGLLYEPDINQKKIEKLI
uniref:LIM zinc-binding domain-containing protein n=2 Tax=Meloidogyne javanica TaxID=6303 RepID=A0A915M6T6_MELJA